MRQPQSLETYNLLDIIPISLGTIPFNEHENPSGSHCLHLCLTGEEIGVLTGKWLVLGLELQSPPSIAAHPLYLPEEGLCVSATTEPSRERATASPGAEPRAIAPGLQTEAQRRRSPLYWGLHEKGFTRGSALRSPDEVGPGETASTED